METQSHFEEQEKEYIAKFAQTPSLESISSMTPEEFKDKLQLNVIAGLGFRTTKQMEEDYFVNYAQKYSDYVKSNQSELIKLARKEGWNVVVNKVVQELKSATEEQQQLN
jgi:hypothetical protein